MTEPERVQFRPRRITWVSVISAVVLIVAFTVVGLLLRSGDTGVRFGVADQVAMVGFGILLAFGALLWARPRVRADAEYIEVRNVLTTQRYSWKLVQQVSFPDGAPWARLELPEDEYVPVMAVQAVDRERAVHAVRTLRALHKRAQEVEQ
ncbi:MAG: PH domain-containing protein [Pseudonocardiaceae bacterium]|nr:PH domain-containing protein [Pseudonocardiaceae bacterium]